MTEIALQAGSPEIPDKLYFKIGEVSELLGVEPYVLRYWESEFPMLDPVKSPSGHRLYRQQDGIDKDARGDLLPRQPGAQQIGTHGRQHCEIPQRRFPGVHQGHGNALCEGKENPR